MVKDNNTSYFTNTNESSIQEIRKIILGLEFEELLKLQTWLKDANRFSEDVAAILPAAILRKVKQDKELELVLVPIIEDAVFTSVKNNPDALAEALYPVMAPAIRRSISEAIRAMLESINQTLENTFSIDRIKIRFQSLISGKSYAELWLAKSGFFRVKHVFLMEKETGLLIEKVSHAKESMEDVDMVSAMLTAIQDFVKDVFSKDIKPGDTLDTIKVQDLNVWILEGSFAVLVVVTDGYIPESYRPHFVGQLEKIHIQYGPELKKYSGQELQNEELKPLLESCLLENETGKKKKSPWKIILASFFILALIAIIFFFKIRDNRRFDNFVTTLDQKPGLIITKSWKEDGLYHISGLRDQSLQYFGQEAFFNKIDSTKVSYSWETFISDEPQFVIQRFERVFAKDEGVMLRVDKDVLKVEGRVKESLQNEIKKYFEMHPEAGKVDFSNLVVLDTIDLLGLKMKVEKISLYFDKNLVGLSEIHIQSLDSLLSYYKIIKKKDKTASLKVLSYTTNKESNAFNRNLAIKRAQEVLSYLVQKNIHVQYSDYEIINNKEKMREVYFMLYLSK